MNPTRRSFLTFSAAFAAWAGLGGRTFAADRPKFGQRSAHGCVSSPRDAWAESPRDDREQADYMEAVFQTFKDKPQWAGMFWWKWDETQSRPHFDPDPAKDRGFRIYGKPACDVFRKWSGRGRAQPAEYFGMKRDNVAKSGMSLNAGHFVTRRFRKSIPRGRSPSLRSKALCGVRSAYAPLIAIAARLAALGGYRRNTGDGRICFLRVSASKCGDLGRFESCRRRYSAGRRHTESVEIPRTTKSSAFYAIP